MEKSIENIWKDGFLKSDALVAPKINRLYHQKSIHIIDKLKRMMRINIYVILVCACINLVLYAALGTPVAGVFIFLLLVGVCWISVKRARTIENIETNLSSYAYIKSFKNWLKLTISSNMKVMRFFYPLIFLAALSPIVHALKAVEVVRDAIMGSGFYLMFGIPVIIWVAALFIAVLMYVFGGKIYLWDVKFFYGRVFNKLDELIAEIEEIQN